MLIYILVRCLPLSKTKMQDQHFLHDLTWLHKKFEKIPNFVLDTYSEEFYNQKFTKNSVVGKVSWKEQEVGKS